MSDFSKLVAGFLNFQENTFKRDEALYRGLAAKQRPRIMVIGCCDSRVDPAIIGCAGPGELFILRNVANLVPPCEHDKVAPTRHGTSAALEFAVRGLEVEHIIVLGHVQCGGIQALLTGAPSLGDSSGFIHHWMQIAKAARDRTLAELGGQPMEVQARFCEQEAIKVSLGNLLSFPWLQERVEQGKLQIHGWYFDIGQGRTYTYDAEADRFVELAALPGPAVSATAAE